ncbi:MAG: SusC/RagA family TonB-linked outer membrane protein [Mucilaginibacter sp.]
MEQLKLFKSWKTLLLLVGMSMFSGIIYAQTITLTGHVTDSKGEPLIGATVKVTASPATAITTNISGDFALRVPANTTKITISYVGFVPADITITPNKRNIGTIPLSEDANSLNEVVVVGYGTQNKRDVTGATATVGAKTLAETPTPNFVDQLKGRVAGLDIQSNSARPGSTPEIHLRGNRTIGANVNSSADQPLLVVDGIPYTGSISDINPDNIKNIEILKDASSTAIYGSRGSGGVLLITTNKGSAGRSITTLTSSLGIRNVESELPVYNGSGYAQLKADALTGSIMHGNGASQSYPLSALEQQGLTNGVNVDWQKYAYQTGINSDTHINISGGNEATTFNIGAGYNAVTDLIPNNRYERYSVQSSIDHRVSKTIRVGLNMTNTLSYRNNPGGFPAGGAASITPLVTPFDDAGNLRLFPYVGAFDATTVTPLYYKYNGQSSISTQRDFHDFTSLYAEWKPIKNLTYKATFGYDFTQTYNGYYNGGSLSPTGIDQTASSAGTTNGDGYHYTLENLLTYDNTFAQKHHITFTALFGTEKNHFQSTGINASNIPSDVNQNTNLNLGTFTSDNGSWSEYGLISEMARLNYSFNGLYAVTATVRGDGNSTLAPGHQWLYYPAFAAAWNISNEKFMQKYNWVDNLKLRAGYGITSNGALGASPYQTLGALGIGQYQYGGGASGNTLSVNLNSIPNPTLTWQKTAEFSLGLDFAILKNRISGTVDVYSQKTTGILLGTSNVASLGGAGFKSNLGSSANKGLEITLSSINIQNKGGFTWATDFNIAFSRERIVALPNGVMADINNSLFVGSPLNVAYDVKKIGIWQIADSPGADLTKSQSAGTVYQKVSGQTFPEYPGEIRVQDKNNNGTIDNGDNQILGSFQPQYTGGISNRFTYKNFDLSFNINARMGGLVVVQYLTSGGSIGGWGFLGTGRHNQPKVNYWTPTNPTGTFPQPDANLQTYPFSSTTQYYDGSWIKLRTINLGYTIPSKIISRIGISSLRVFAQCLNPWIIYNPAGKATNGTVFDPETNSFGGAVGGQFSGNPVGPNGGRINSVGYGATPFTRDFVFGLSVRF